MRKFLILDILLLYAAIFAQEPSARFAEANKLYEQGKYPEAVNIYKELVYSGKETPEIYFNLGNACFKDKKIGYAILYYEKALKLSPRDADIKYNLDYVKNFVKETAVEDAVARLLNSIFCFFTLNELAVLACILSFIFFSLLMYHILIKKELFFWLTISSAIIFVIFAVWLGIRIYQNESVLYGIITESQIEAKSAPQDDYPVSFTIPEGKKVRIVRTRQLWYEVYLQSENLKGWIKKETLKNI